jgi:hypothetical protein
LQVIKRSSPNYLKKLSFVYLIPEVIFINTIMTLFGLRKSSDYEKSTMSDTNQKIKKKKIKKKTELVSL